MEKSQQPHPPSESAASAEPLPETSEIQRLDIDTVRRITAEQAISDLASIVKELMDNALDAESTTIKIRLFGQGLDIIEVSDDGNGIPVGSLSYAATRHATSKIERIDDIYTGTGLTMGFRGEALFSTVCVSESLVVASRTANDALATKLVFGNDGSPIAGQSETLARKVGTTVAVLKPFARLPARRADLVRRIQTERTKLFKLVEAYGIFNVGVSFHLMDIGGRHNHREDVGLVTSSNSKSIQETASSLLGPVFVKGTTSLEVSLESYFRTATNHPANMNNKNNKYDDEVCYHWGIRGLISKEPLLLAASQQSLRGSSSSKSRIRSAHYYSINGRVVELPRVTALLKKLWTNACTTQCSAGNTNNNASANIRPPKKPSALLEFTLPNNAFDINLSPDKQTVLFTNEDELLGILGEYVSKLWSLSSDGSSSSSHVFVDQSNDSGLSQQPLANLPRRAAVRVSDAGISSGHGSSNDGAYERAQARACASSSCKSITTEEGEEDADDLPPRPSPALNYDENEKDPQESHEYEYDDDHHHEYKRRFAFVHDVSKAKMQHESEARRRTEGRSRSDRYNHLDDHCSSSDNNNNNSSAEPSAFPEPNLPGGKEPRPQLHQNKQCPVTVVKPNSATTTRSRDHTNYPMPDQTKKSGSIEVTCTMEEHAAPSPMEENAEEQQSSLQLPVDRISDSDRLKWNEIQSKFRRNDSDEIEIDVQAENGTVPTQLSRFISVDGIRSASSKPPVTPEAECDEPLSGAPDPCNAASAEPPFRSSRQENLDQFAHSGGKKTSNKLKYEAKRKTKRRGLQQFAHRPSNRDDHDSPKAAVASKPQRREEVADLSSCNESKAPSVFEGTTDNAKDHEEAAAKDQRLEFRKRKSRDESKGTGIPDLKDSSRETQVNSSSTKLGDTNAEEGAVSTEDDALTTNNHKVQVVWDSFLSTEDVCSRARMERLNMRKRKQEMHGIRRLLKSRIRHDRKFEHPDTAGDETKMDEENESQDSFIRISKSTFRSGMRVIGQFNLGFILALCPQNHLWILDQHACDEKHNFELLVKKTVLHVQPLIRPLPLELTPSEEACVLDHRNIFAANGFKFVFDPNAPIRHRLALTSLPHSGARDGRKAVEFGPLDVSVLCSILIEGSSYEAGSGGTGTDGTGFYGNNAVRRHAGTTGIHDNTDRLLARLPKAIAMFASRACRNSIMIGTSLSQKDMISIVQKLAMTDSPWNCPHGRPTMRHVADVLPMLWKDEWRGAEHIAVPTISIAPVTQAEED